MLPLTKEELKSHQEAESCYICGKKLLKKFANDKNYRKVRDHCHYTGKYRGLVHSICNSEFNVSNEISVVFHNGSNYDGHFIIKELAMILKENLNVSAKIEESKNIFPFQ